MATPNGQTTFHAKENPDEQQGEFRHRHLINRRAFVGMAAAGAASPLLARAAAAQTAPKARNVVLVHGLFADGSCWSEVIARLQPRGSTSPPCRTR